VIEVQCKWIKGFISVLLVIEVEGKNVQLEKIDV
jgi:hypothetical protein